MSYKRAMGISRNLAGLLLALMATPLFAQTPDFSWSWQEQEVIGRNDASIGNTSKLTEPERAALLDAIVQRLQKPMSQAGYDEDRIREIASTTRVRFVDMGSGKPLVFATSLGMEGGCDPMGNCPVWIFRRTADGFVPLLDAIAASYTLQSTEGPRDLILMHHVSAKESGLQLFRLDDGKLELAGCYVALWPTRSDDPTQVSDPTYKPCDVGNSETAAPVAADTKPEAPAADTKQTAPDQTPEALPNSQEPSTKPDTEAKPDAPQVQPESKADAAPQPPDAKPTSPDAPQPPAGDAKQANPDQGQPASQENQAEPQTKPAAPDQAPPSAPDAPQSSDQKPATADTPQPSSDQKPAAPDAPQSDAKQPAPDAEPTPLAPDTPPPSDQKPATPDTPQPPSEQKPAAPDAPQSDSKQPAPDAEQAPPAPDTPPPPDQKPATPDTPQPPSEQKPATPDAPQSPPQQP